MTKDRAYWGSPEKYMGPRPATYLSAARPGGDMVAMVSAALASAAVAIQDESLQVADVYLQKAISLYALVRRGRGGAFRPQRGLSAHAWSGCEARPTSALFLRPLASK